MLSNTNRCKETDTECEFKRDLNYHDGRTCIEDIFFVVKEIYVSLGCVHDHKARLNEYEECRTPYDHFQAIMQSILKVSDMCSCLKLLKI